MQRGGQDLQMRELLDTIREPRLTMEALRKELNAKEKQMETMQEQLNYFQKKLFGTSSEKHSLAVEGQLGLFDEVESEAAKETAPEPDAEEEPAVSPRPRRPRTRKEELLRGIPVTEKIVDLRRRRGAARNAGRSCSRRAGSFFGTRSILSRQKSPSPESMHRRIPVPNAGEKPPRPAPTRRILSSRQPYPRR